MIPTHFGSRERLLYGTYHPAAGRRARRGAVICAPIGQEYLRAHRACRLLGERLSQAGVDALRFDYYGTGDSGGRFLDLTLDSARADIDVAVDELADLARVRSITVIGLRVGALLATEVAHREPSVRGLVLWDPVVDGSALAADLRARGHPLTTPAGACESEGFAYSSDLLNQLSGLSATSYACEADRILVAVSDREPDRVAPLLAALDSGATKVDQVRRPSVPSWAELGDIGAGAVPSELIDAIVAWTE